MTAPKAGPRIGIVLIGRNEAARLPAALASLPPGLPTVYVDSGSTDSSMSLAEAAGATAIRLDLSLPFTAARARNTGAFHLRQSFPTLEYFFFMDGDCQLLPDFLPPAAAFLDANPAAAIACGRRRELEPRQNIYHRLSDMEWNTPPGQADCGGDALMRASAFWQVGGFDPSLIAGEEPDLCVRLRLTGHTIHRLRLDMTLHDVAMTALSQWWRRSVRAGYAFISGATRNARAGTVHWLRPAVSAWIWALLIPGLTIGLLWPTRGLSLVMLLLYLKPFLGAYRRRRRPPLGDSPSDAALYAFFCLVGKFSELQGQLRFFHQRLTRRATPTLIEYKSASPSCPAPVNE